MLRRIILSALSVSLLAACSHQQVYDAVHQNRLQDCEKFSGPQYRDCIQQYDQSYSDYQRERRELLGTEE
ncbi:hypothetical protein SAMN04487965_1642 [Microbulbifer donghaiensis]|uniref:Uncharacterized protein n=1 Tax=Microbulbifer donghaiensis TaxID=494016 RepID=A0A1M4ZTV0_9GAMM|nr:hypothetical protein [Microbulbifer donghaiensis]SHF21212.1 hypothetical protein SAMN04487965_1642 [Microbulbifer donghaiensis]